MSLYKLRHWINPENLNMYFLCQNSSPGAIQYIINNNLYENFSNNDWQSLCLNENSEAIDLLEKNLDKIHWEKLCFNRSPKAIALLRKNLSKVVWYCLCNNDTKEAIDLLKENVNKTDFLNLSNNKSPFVAEILKENPHFIERLNYPSLHSNNASWALDLLEKYFEDENSKKYWEYLSKNTSPRAIDILEKNFDKICWHTLSANNSLRALDLLEKNKDKISLNMLVRNESIRAIKLIEEMDKMRILNEIDWIFFSRNPYAINIIKKYSNKINYISLSKNSEIFELNLEYLKERMDIIREELCIKVFHPRFFNKLWTFEE